MPGSLFDVSVWAAAVFPTHPLHPRARQALEAATPADPAVFCRSTEQSFPRLVSTPVVLKAYGAEGLTNRDALVALDALLALPQVSEREEAPGMRALWHRLAARDTPSPKVWMDARRFLYKKLPRHSGCYDGSRKQTARMIPTIKQPLRIVHRRNQAPNSFTANPRRHNALQTLAMH